MLTAANYAANLKTAAKNAAATAGVTGIPPSSWTLTQRQAYNQSLTAQILKYPNSFAPETVNIATATNTDYGLRGHNFDSALGTAVDTVADTVRTLNPLDPQNIKTTGLWLLVAAVALGAAWIFFRTPPSSRA